MSMMAGQFGRGSDDVGQTVATFSTYEAAQKAVSSLIAAEIPAREITIVGQGLRSQERVTGRLGYATAARSGAINGLLLGMLFAAVFVLGVPNVPIQAFIGVLFVGIAIGMIASLLTFSIVRRRRDFASVMQLIADHYDVAVAASSAGKARQVLGHHAAPVAAARPAAAAPAAPLEPPRYGQRIDAAASPSAPGPADAEPADGGEAGDGDTAAGDTAPGDGDSAPGDGEPDRTEPNGAEPSR